MAASGATSVGAGERDGGADGLAARAAALRFGRWRLRLETSEDLGLCVSGLIAGGDDDDPSGCLSADAPADYVDAVLLAPEHRERFFALVDEAGLLVCLGVGGDDADHRGVRGRSSRGRLSQGEFYHHDGCVGPTKPRIVEIRCPYQQVERDIATAIAPFPEVVVAMWQQLPSRLRTGALAALPDAAMDAAGHDTWLHVQGQVMRAVRRALDAEAQRAYLRAVDAHVGAYRARWRMGESRFIANAPASEGVDGAASRPRTKTMQHRRAYLQPHSGGRANGHLLKRWPASPAGAIDHEVCALGDAAPAPRPSLGHAP